jgi:hypothetical protein
VTLEIGCGRSTGHHELRFRHRCQCRDGIADTLSRHQPADGQQPVHAGRPGDLRADRGEVVEIDAARHHRDTVPVRAHPHELEQLVAAGGDDVVGVPDDAGFDVDAVARTGVIRTLLRGLDHTEGMERLHDRDAEPAGCVECRDTRHPEVRVHHVGAVAPPAPVQLVGEIAHVRQQIVLRDVRGRTGGNVLDDDAARELHAPRQLHRVAPGVHDDGRAAPGERCRERGDVHVLPAGVDTAEHCQRTRMFGHHGDLHAVTSTSSASQSARNRARPYRSSAAVRACFP